MAKPLFTHQVAPQTTEDLFGDQNRKFVVLNSVYYMFARKPIIKVERIAVEVIAELHAASLQPHSFPPLGLELQNKLLQRI